MQTKLLNYLLAQIVTIVLQKFFTTVVSKLENMTKEELTQEISNLYKKLKELNVKDLVIAYGSSIYYQEVMKLPEEYRIHMVLEMKKQINYE